MILQLLGTAYNLYMTAPPGMRSSPDVFTAFTHNILFYIIAEHETYALIEYV
jgi:hypothetical protein